MATSGTMMSEFAQTAMQCPYDLNSGASQPTSNPDSDATDYDTQD